MYNVKRFRISPKAIVDHVSIDAVIPKRGKAFEFLLFDLRTWLPRKHKMGLMTILYNV